MRWLISLLGVALALAGAISLGNGISYIRMDWGATEVIAGTVALAGGCVTFALGAVLFALRDFSRQGGRRVSRDLDDAMGRDADPSAEPSVGALSGRFKSKRATIGRPEAAEPDVRTEPAPSELPGDRPNDGFERSAAIRPGFERDEPMVLAPVIEQDQSPRSEPAPSGSLLSEAPTVVGRYEANGASYVLFSDGTIEVETETGTHRFGSMADLKDHIERQDAG